MTEATPSAAPRALPSGRWAIAVTAVLLIVFLAIGWIQMRQVRQIDTTVYYTEENISWVFSQLELEYVSLRDSLRQAERYPENIDPAALRERYEIFVSRIPLVQPAQISRMVAPQPVHVRTVALIKQFIDQADPWLSENASTTLNPGLIARLLREMEPLGEPIHDMSLMTTRVMGETLGNRNAAAREQAHISIALNIFQGLLTLVFAVLLIRKVRSLEKRRAELEALADSLLEARRGADVANVAKSVFLANISHELRTPLNGILGMLSLISPRGLHPDQADYLLSAEQSAEHLLSIVNDILDASRLESKNLQIAPTDINLQQLVKEIASVMAGLARIKGLDLKVTVSPLVPQWVHADGMRIRQILQNLLSNAIKFSTQGKISLEIDTSGDACEALAGAMVMLRLRISDQGLGIDEETQSRLFQRFSQGDASTSRQHGGSGLGLEISRSLARLMGGDITLESRLNHGSVFTVQLPVRCAAAPLEAERPAALPTRRPAGSPGLDILVAEDQAINRKFMEVMLKLMGHQVRFAENGEQAVAEVRRAVPDVIFMDLQMPAMDGLEATRILRLEPGAASTLPIIALTADAFEETHQRALAAGMNSFLSKPVSIAQVQSELTQLFGLRGAAAHNPKRPDSASAVQPA